MPEDALDARFDRLRQDLRQEFRQDIQASAAETRRHFDVVAESLRSEIQVVAEGLSALDESVERFRNEVHQEFGKVDRMVPAPGGEDGSRLTVSWTGAGARGPSR